MHIRTITEAGNLEGKRVIVRGSFNVPVKDGVVQNAYRIVQGLSTLKYLQAQGARTIVIGHIGREKDETLMPVLSELKKYLPIEWGGAITDEALKGKVDTLQNGEMLLIENLRQDDRENDNNEAFAALIASYGDIYVNDAFDNAHREHASMVGVPKLLPAYAGINLAEELTNLEKVVVPEHPSLFIIGGAKFETKMPLVEKYLHIYDNVFVSGALMNDVFKAKGYEVGTSLVSDVSLAGAAFLEDEKLLIPIDVIVKGPNGVRTTTPDDVKADEAIMDSGPKTTELLASYIDKAKTVLWNGPFGNFEAGFEEGTVETVKHLAASNAFSVIGGGDTVAAIEKLGLNDKLGFVSTGGGAMLTYLENGSTPSIDCLKS
jgi:phosphoglycerate kinase